MFTAEEINRKIKAGMEVYAHPEGYEGDYPVLRTRVGLCDILQVQITLGGRKVWRNAAWSSVKIITPVEEVGEGREGKA